MAFGSLESPNIIFLITDQERQTQYFPAAWVEENLTTLNTFKKNGITFTDAICNSNPCGPSRGVIFSGMFSQKTGIVGNFGTLADEDITMLKIFQQMGYKLYYKGKWHLNADFTTFSTSWTDDSFDDAEQTAQDEDTAMSVIGWQNWTSPDFGTDLVFGPDITDSDEGAMANGRAYNDQRIIWGKNPINPDEQNITDFFSGLSTSEEPFCLVISLLNPHDVSVYPQGYIEAGYGDFNPDNFSGFTLPASFYENLSTNSKPTTQQAYLDELDESGGGYFDPETALNYLKFYAYLQQRNEALITYILESFKALPSDIVDNTIFIRMADHGEMACSHGGLRQKMHTFYREATNVPLIFSNAQLWPDPVETDQLISLVDLVPTVAGVIGADTSGMGLQGTDYSATLLDPINNPTQDYAFYGFYQGDLFTDASPSTTDWLISGWQTGPDHDIPNYKYAVYYQMDSTNAVDQETLQFEMYDMANDSEEMVNLAPLTPAAAHGEYPPEMVSLHAELTDFLDVNIEEKPTAWPDTLPTDDDEAATDRAAFPQIKRWTDKVRSER